MIFLTVALKSEANPIIAYFKLKQQSGNGSFKVYAKDNIMLIVTGTGGIKSAICTTYILTKYGAKKTDILINIGISGCYSQSREAKENYGKLFIVNSLKNKSSGRNFYPDMILKTSLPEASLITVNEIWQKDFKVTDKTNTGTGVDKIKFNNFTDMAINDNILIDMEGSYIYEASCIFLYAHNIFIMKIISDFGDPGSVRKESVENLISGRIEEISTVVEQVSKWGGIFESESPVSEKEIQFLDDISHILMLTCYQRTEFRKLYEMHLIRGKNRSDEGHSCKIIEKIENIISNSNKVKEKKEGKIIYAKIRKLLYE